MFFVEFLRVFVVNKNKIHSRKNGFLIYCFALSAISHEKKIAQLMVVTVTRWSFACWSLVDNFYTFLLVQFLVSYFFRVKVLVDFTKVFCNTFCQPQWYDESEEHQNTPESAQHHCEEINSPKELVKRPKS